jgi:hypothetical protein
VLSYDFLILYSKSKQGQPKQNIQHKSKPSPQAQPEQKTPHTAKTPPKHVPRKPSEQQKPLDISYFDVPIPLTSDLWQEILDLDTTRLGEYLGCASHPLDFLPSAFLSPPS